MIKTGIIGGAGYTAGELLRILVNHPEVEITFAYSSSQAGKPISEVHDDLLGQTNLTFSSDFKDVDVLFLCQGHGRSREFLESNSIPSSTKIIDLSQDFRHKDSSTLDGRKFTYGLPELKLNQIKNATNIANPGCFATAIQLAILPLAKARLLENELHIHAITGSTGAGQAPGPTTHFSWRNNNMSIYKAFEHQHLIEITESLKSLQTNYDQDLNFIPVRGNFTRGILASVYTTFKGSKSNALELFQDYYSSSPFTKVTDSAIHLKQVVNTNNCFISVEKHKNKILVTSIIDNLLKGASGQAVENMNLMFGLDQTTGLKLKASLF